MIGFVSILGPTRCGYDVMLLLTASETNYGVTGHAVMSFVCMHRAGVSESRGISLKDVLLLLTLYCRSKLGVLRPVQQPGRCPYRISMMDGFSI